MQQLWIDGGWQPASGGRPARRIEDPATLEVLAAADLIAWDTAAAPSFSNMIV